jgi:hypothetical protein
MKFQQRSLRVLPCILALASASSAFARPTELIQNGGFESTSNGADKQTDRNTQATSWTVTQHPSSPYFAGTGMGGYSFIFSSPNSTIPTYTDAPGTLQLWGATGTGVNNGLVASPDGGNFWGTDANWNTGELTQTVNDLTPGVSYTLSFWTATAQQYNYYGDVYTFFHVNFGGTTLDTPQYSITSKGFSGWQKETLNFTATSASQVLSFLADGTPGSALPPIALLDGISLQATAAPEPQALSLAAGGILLVAGIARSLRRSAK